MLQRRGQRAHLIFHGIKSHSITIPRKTHKMKKSERILVAAMGGRENDRPCAASPGVKPYVLSGAKVKGGTGFHFSFEKVGEIGR